MASGRENVSIIAVRDLWGSWIAVDAPQNIKGSFDGSFLEDNGFCNTEDLPTETGLYKLDCQLYWDDGDNGMLEPSDAEWEFTVKSITQIWLADGKVEGNGERN